LLLGLLGVTAFLHFARPVLLPLAVAILLAFVLNPLVVLIQRRGLSRVPTVMIVAVLVFVFLGGFGYLLSRQITGLLVEMPRYKDQIVQKIEGLRGAGEGGAVSRFLELIHDVSEGVSGTEKARQSDRPQSQPGHAPDNPYYVTTAPSNMSRALEIAGPAGEGVVATALVIVLVVFMLIQRENLRNRIVRLVGRGRLIMTTRALDEGASRISGYLVMMLTINVAFGVAMSLGLLLLGVITQEAALYRYALLWGFITGALRFVPYLGTWLGAILLFGFNVATLPGWALPLWVFAYFCVVEVVTANVVEPLLFGKSTGSSPVALLLAAAFWTWLWGPIGLILSTPMTVVLVLLGKYVPPLRFFEVLMGEEPALEPAVNYYQRLVARDQDEASELAEEYLEAHSVEALCNDMLLPALMQARRDRERGELDAEDQQFILDATREVLEDLTPATQVSEGGDKAVLMGCPAHDEADELMLRMLAAPLAEHGHAVEVLSSDMLTSEVLERVGTMCPRVVCIGALAPGGLAPARYLCKRMRAQCPGVKIIVARWGEAENLDRVQKRLTVAGADAVTLTLAETRAAVLPHLQVATATAASEATTPALTV